MIGLPTETNDDLDELVALVGKVVALAPRGGSQIHVSISPFSPKSHTPFQWAGQIPREEIERRNNYLARRLQRFGVKVSLRDAEISVLEGMLGLGDRDAAQAVLAAWRAGARFDGWSEHFDFGRWERAFVAAGIEPRHYLDPRDPEAPLPWDTVDCGVDREFLAKDWHRAQRAGTLPDCRLEAACYKCSACDGDIQHIFAQLAEMAPSGGVADGAAASAAPEPPPPDFDPRNADPDQPGQEDRKWRAWRQQAATKCWYRAEYTKTGDLIFLGHLDFQRQLQLALRRSGLPVAYSKGYNPHPLLKFGPPLPVGVAGLRESLDMAFECQVPGWVEQLNRELPAGLVFRRAVVVGGQAPVAIDQVVQRFDYRVHPAAAGLGRTVVRRGRRGRGRIPGQQQLALPAAPRQGRSRARRPSAGSGRRPRVDNRSCGRGCPGAALHPDAQRRGRHPARARFSGRPAGRRAGRTPVQRGRPHGLSGPSP